MKVLGRVISLLFVSILVLLPALSVVATSDFRADVVVLDSSSTDRTYVPVMVDFNTSGSVSLGLLSSSGLDSAVLEGTTVLPFMLSTTQILFAVPELLSTQEKIFYFDTGYAPAQTSFSIIPGSGGYVTTADAAALEPGSNFEVAVDCGVDTVVGKIGEPVFYKAATLDCNVSAAGELTANIYGAVGTITTQSADNSLTKAYTNVWVGQTYTAATDMWITTISIYGEEEGTAVGNAVVSIRETLAGDITNTVIATAATRPATDFPAEGFPDYVVFTFASPVFVYSGQVIGIALQVTGGDTNNDIHWMHQTTDVLAGGNRFTGAGATPTWTSTTGDCHVRVSGAVPSKSVTATGITSGEHTIKVSADGSNLYIYDGATLKDTEALGGVSVQNTAYNYIWLDSESVVYASSISVTIGGTLIVHYHPAAIIVGTTLPDLEGAAQNGTFTWGSNSDLSVSISGLNSVSSYVSESSESSGTGGVGITAPPTTGLYAPTATVTGLPYWDLFEPASVSLEWSTNVLYSIMAIFVAIGLGVGVGIATGSTLLAIIAVAVGLVIGVGTGTLGWWVVLVYIIFSGGYVVASKSM